LFPLMSFIPALILIYQEFFNIEYNKLAISNKRIICASILFGISAMQYFIFTIYFLVILSIFIYFVIKKQFAFVILVKKVILPFLGGYGLYIYAHLSIIKYDGFNGYINHIKNINSAYGITSKFSSSLIERIDHVWNLINNLSGGDVVSIAMLGNHNSYVNLGKYIFAIYLIMLFVFIVIKKLGNGEVDERVIKVSILSKVLAGLIGIHCCIGVFIGKSLNFQHYIMLLPIIYIGLSTSIQGIYLLLSNDKNLVKSNIWHRSCLIISFIILFIHVVNIVPIYREMNRTGGAKYYSDAINRLAAFTYNTSQNSVFICPQWGYWVSVALMTGGEKEIWNNNSEEEIIKKINSTPEKDTYYVILDKTNPNDFIDKIEIKTGLMNVKTIVFYSRDGLEAFKVKCLQKNF